LKSFFYIDVKYSNSIIWIAIVALLWSCAKQGIPTGGPRDVTPPKVLNEQPLNNSKNFNAKKIVITFDELIQLDNISQNLLVSPPLATSPEIVADGNKLKIKFEKNQLKDSTTYSFFFGKSIKDNNAGNVLSNFTFAFSTGPTIDTLRISGTVSDLENNKPLEDAYVMLYTNLNDSAPRKELPIFITKTDKTGAFQIKNIKKTKYRLYALKDANNDMKFNQPKEAFAFYDSLIVPNVTFKKVTDTIRCSTKDSLLKKLMPIKDSITIKKDKPCRDTIISKIDTIYTPNTIKLYSFVEEKKTQYLVDFKRERREKLQFVFNIPLIQDSLVIEPLKITISDKQIKKELSPQKDSVYYWLLDKSLRDNDSLKFVLHYFKHDTANVLKWLTDTIKPRYEARKDKQKGQLICGITSTLRNNANINVTSGIPFTISTPIASIDKSKITLNLAVDTSCIKTTEGGFYLLDSAKKETYSKHSLPRLKKYSPKYFIEKQYIKKYQASKNKFLLTFDKPLLPSDTISLKFENREQSSWLITERDITSNSLFCWITDKTLLSRKSFTFYAYFNGNVIDTLLFIRPKLGGMLPTSGGEELVIPSMQSNSLCLDEMIPLYMINPIASFDTSGIYLIKKTDTSKTHIRCDFKRLNKYPRTLFICAYNLQKANDYVLKVKEHSLTDIRGTYNVDQEFSIKTQSLQSNYILTPITGFSIKQDSLYPRKQNIYFKWIDKKKYQLTILPGAITDVYGNSNDSLQMIVGISSKDDYGTLFLSMKGIKDVPVIIQIWDREGKTLLDSKSVSVDATITFNYLKAADYKLKAVYDKNGNKKWDTGLFSENRQAEKIQYKNEIVSIKAGWENKVEWDLQESPKTTTPPIQIPEKKAK